MTAQWDILGPEGIKFFGKITATVTHELNNAIGVINEQAGLLEDLSALAGQGSPPDIHQWTATSKNISRQVGRTHQIIKQLNAFAHSMDRPEVDSDPHELLSLSIALTRRILAQNNVTAQLPPAKKKISIITIPFVFIQLMSNCLIFAKDHCNETQTIRLDYSGEDQILEISFSGLRFKTDAAFPGKIEQELLCMVNGQINFSRNQENLIVTMPIHHAM